MRRGGRAADGIGFRATDTGDAWVLSDGARPGTARLFPGTPSSAGPPVVQAPAADLLLWLYGRTELDTTGVPGDVLERFRAMTFTD